MGKIYAVKDCFGYDPSYKNGTKKKSQEILDYIGKFNVY